MSIRKINLVCVHDPCRPRCGYISLDSKVCCCCYCSCCYSHCIEMDTFALSLRSFIVSFLHVHYLHYNFDNNNIIYLIIIFFFFFTILLLIITLLQKYTYSMYSKLIHEINYLYLFNESYNGQYLRLQKFL